MASSSRTGEHHAVDSSSYELALLGRAIGAGVRGQVGRWQVLVGNERDSQKKGAELRRAARVWLQLTFFTVPSVPSPIAAIPFAA